MTHTVSWIDRLRIEQTLLSECKQNVADDERQIFPRTIAVGTPVAFELLPKLGRYEASGLTDRGSP